MRCASIFNQPLESWDASKVRVMCAMFYQSRFNQPLEDWNVSSAAIISDMFKEASSYNHVLCKWYNNTLKATATVDGMFIKSGFPNRLDTKFTTKESFCQQCLLAPVPAPTKPLSKPTLPAPRSLPNMPFHILL
jgi:hypothetical protein